MTSSRMSRRPALTLGKCATQYGLSSKRVAALTLNAMLQ
eukprot:CAMPEP_0205828714 /NCGR_PEP_ID=MMETSP0206-20130828/35927_1 /ASSEMBLY_ACC=CAM_ASM_000279 /TAXON_ID=36767 /ORGANISM="Euplotes focardii, Strain TN1" /LENGTH=38 /DNA_ID= /DNA_START= /DNA_END= /DNA_ORIENTATION=